MSRYWNDSDWSDYEGEFVGWGLLSLLFILARLKSMNLDGLSFVKKSLVDLIGALLSLAGGWFLCFVIAFFLSCINLDWFFNRDQQQINKVDWSVTESNTLAINSRVLEIDSFVTSFLLYILPPHLPACVSFFQLCIHFYFFVCYFCLLSELFTYFLSFLFSLPSRSCRYGSSYQTLS